MSAELVAIVSVGVGLLAVLVPLILTLHTRTAADVAALRVELRGDIEGLRGELAALRKDVSAQGERLAALEVQVAGIDVRLARIEGAVLGPWRPEAEKEG